MARKNPELLHDPEKPSGRDERLAEIEEMIARLRKRREHERARTRVVGLPIKGAVPPIAPEPPQRTLPLGPVPSIVRTRKPKPRW